MCKNLKKLTQFSRHWTENIIRLLLFKPQLILSLDPQRPHLKVEVHREAHFKVWGPW